MANLGRPTRLSVEIGQGFTFMGDSETLCSDLGLVMNFAAPEARWQMG